MKRFQHLLAIMVVLTALLCCLSVTAFADDAKSGTCGDNVTWALSNKGVLTISGTGEMTSAPWRTDYTSVIKEVIIEEGVSSIYYSAFENCSSLSKVSIPSSVSHIGYSAFEFCPIVELSLPEGVKSVERYAFRYCSIKKLTIPQSLDTIGSSAFYSNSIENLYLPNLDWLLTKDTSPISLYFKNLFVNGELLTNLVIPDYITTIYPNTLTAAPLWKPSPCTMLSQNWAVLHSITVQISVKSSFPAASLPSAAKPSPIVPL